MQQSVLICPLYWGIGHATRMVPLAGMLQNRGYRIFIAAPEPLLAVFDDPQLTKIVLSSYRIRYPLSISLTTALLLQSPILILQALIDRVRIAKIIRSHNIDLLISDNRFGCRSRRVRSIYITHQINIISTINPDRKSRLLSALHRTIINRYDECWIPDLPGSLSLSGVLSDPTQLSVKHKYIGILSRLSTATPLQPAGFTLSRFHLLILSGPEPMKSRFGMQVSALFSGRDEKLVIVGSALPGKRYGDNYTVKDNISRFGHLAPDSLRYLIEKSESVICRSGYSTVMDLVALRKSALLVPTPGQSEQIYLAGYLLSKNLFSTVSQKELSLEDIIQAPGRMANPRVGPGLIDFKP